MNRLRTDAAALFACLLVLGPAAARADPVGFSYSVSFSPDNLSAWGPGPISLSQSVGADGSITYNFGSGSAAATPVAGTGSAAPGADWASAVPAQVPLATLTTAVLGGAAGTFTFSTAPGITLLLTDAKSGASAAVPLGIYLSGSVSPDGASSLSAAAENTGSVMLGDHNYLADFSLGNATFPAAGIDAVTVYAQVFVDRPDPVTVDPGSPGPADNGGSSQGNDFPPSPAAAREPSGLVLAGGGVCFLAVAAIRKRRPRLGAVGPGRA